MFTFRNQVKPDVTSMTRSLQDQRIAAAGRRLRNTAELSGELSVGEAGLAVARAGWTPVRGGLNEARISEHGTRPLPAPAQNRATPGPAPDRDSAGKEPDRP